MGGELLPFDYGSSQTLDVLAQLEEERKRREQALAEAKSALESHDRPAMDAGEGIGQALLQVAPILIGGAVQGREGAYTGALAGLTGAQAYGKNLAADEEVAKNLDLLKYQEALNDDNKMDALIDTAKIQHARDQDELQGKIGLEAIRAQNRPGSAASKGMTPEEAQKSGIEWGSPAYQKAQLDKQARDAQSDKTHAEQFHKDIEREADIIGKGQVLGAEERRITKDLVAAEKLKKSGLAFPNAPTDKQVDNALNLRGAFYEVNALQDELGRMYQDQGFRALGPEAQTQNIINAINVIGFKNLQGMGANFTLMERGLTSTALGSPESLAKFMRQSAQGWDPAKGVETSMRLNQQAYVRRLLGEGGIDTSFPEAYRQIKDAPTVQALHSMGLKWKGDDQIEAPNAMDDIIAGYRRQLDDVRSNSSRLSELRGRLVSSNSDAAPAKSTATPTPQRTEVAPEQKYPDLPGNIKESRDGVAGYRTKSGSWYPANEVLSRLGM